MSIENIIRLAPKPVNIFGNAKVKYIHVSKSFIRDTSPKTVDILPNSSSTWPFGDMWGESGERREAEERKEYVDVEEFFDELKEAGCAGLIFLLQLRQPCFG